MWVVLIACLIWTACLFVWFLRLLRREEKLARSRNDPITYNIHVFRLMGACKPCVYDPFPYAYPDRAVTRADLAQAMAAAYLSYCDGEQVEYANGVMVESSTGVIVLVMPEETPEFALNELKSVLERIRAINVRIDVFAGGATIKACA